MKLRAEPPANKMLSGRVSGPRRNPLNSLIIQLGHGQSISTALLFSFGPTGSFNTEMLPRLRISLTAIRTSLITSINNPSRGFSTSRSVCSTEKAVNLTETELNLDLHPPYPYGKAQWYKQSTRGLYGGLQVRFGNKVSEKNEIKTRRKWKVNVKRKKLYSVALGKSLRL